jgi:hypothetical protein
MEDRLGLGLRSKVLPAEKRRKKNEHRRGFVRPDPVIVGCEEFGDWRKRAYGRRDIHFVNPEFWTFQQVENSIFSVVFVALLVG